MANGSVNFMEFSDPAEGIQGVISLEPEKKKKNFDPAPQPAAAPSAIDGYRSYCDVDTSTVLYRLKKALWPFDRRKFLENKADLYGAFWVPTTLIFILSVAGSVAATLSSDEGYTFDPQAIVTTAGLIYAFVFTIPAILAFALLVGIETTYYDLLSLYGYSYCAFWPAAILSVFNYSFIRWLVFSVGSLWASVLITKNYYNEIEFLDDWKKYLTILLSVSGYVALTLVANLYLFQ